MEEEITNYNENPVTYWKKQNFQLLLL